MFRQFLFAIASAMLFAMVTQALHPNHRPERSQFVPEYTVSSKGSIAHQTSFFNPRDLTKEYTVGDAVDYFTADGVTTTFPLSYFPLGSASVDVSSGGLILASGIDYTLAMVTNSAGKPVTAAIFSADAIPPKGNVVRIKYRGEFTE